MVNMKTTKLKSLPTFTIRDCQKAGACEAGVKFYGDLFGMDTKINVADILNAPYRTVLDEDCWNESDAGWAMSKFSGQFVGFLSEYLFQDNMTRCLHASLRLLELGYDVTGELAHA